MSEVNRHPNDPNKGLNTRTFMISVCIAMVLLLIGALVVVGTHRGSLLWGVSHPKRTAATTPE